MEYTDPSLGRYVQSDPIGLNGGLNTYVYVLNRPLTIKDLLGLAPIFERDYSSATTAAGCHAVYYKVHAEIQMAWVGDGCEREPVNEIATCIIISSVPIATHHGLNYRRREECLRRVEPERNAYCPVQYDTDGLYDSMGL